MNLGDQQRRLSTQLLMAKTVKEAQEIGRQLAAVNRQIAQVRAHFQAQNDPTGRLTDLAYLRREFDRAPNQAIRAKVAQAASVIRNESEHQRRLRKEMVTAQRNGNRLRAREIGEHLHQIYG